MSADKVSEHARSMLEAANLPDADVRRDVVRPGAQFRTLFPSMTQLLKEAEAYRLAGDSGNNWLLAWRGRRGMDFGWICSKGQTSSSRSTPVIREHRILFNTVGRIDTRVGARAIVPVGDVTLFGIPRFRGLGGKRGHYVEVSSRCGATAIPNADDFVVFGVEGQGDLWVYTRSGKRVYEIVFGDGPLARAGVLKRVPECGSLWVVRGGEVFVGFVEYFAKQHLVLINGGAL